MEEYRFWLYIPEDGFGKSAMYHMKAKYNENAM